MPNNSQSDTWTTVSFQISWHILFQIIWLKSAGANQVSFGLFRFRRLRSNRHRVGIERGGGRMTSLTESSPLERFHSLDRPALPSPYTVEAAAMVLNSRVKLVRPRKATKRRRRISKVAS